MFRINSDEKKWHILGLLALVILVFAKTLSFEFVWDDLILLVDQGVYESASLPQLFLTPLNGLEYLPIRDLTYVINYKLWGWNPLGFHLTNLVLYFLNVWAVYGFTMRLNETVLSTDKGVLDWKPPIAGLMVATIFATHPVHSEVVSFIHGRNVLLSGLFFFLALQD